MSATPRPGAPGPGAPGPGALPPGRSRHDLVAEVARALAAVPDGARVVVALSGGPDSTALAYLLTDARPDLVPTLVHVRHGLRDDTEDLEVVRRHATWLGLPLLIREVEVTRRGHGIEAAARAARYAALREVATSVRARLIAVGHTAEDQAETVLLRAARGTGTDGLAAMRPHHGGLVRPLLRLRRADVQRFVVLEGLPTVTDPTNRDPGVRRAVVRHEVLPALAPVAGDVVGALTRLAELAAADADALEQWAGQIVGEHARWVGPVVAVETRRLGRLPDAVAHRVLRRLVAEVAPSGPPLSAAALSELTTLQRGRAVDLPHGLRGTGAGGWVTLGPRALPTSEPVELAWPGATAWAPAGVQVRSLLPEPAAGQLALGVPGMWTPPREVGDAACTPPGGDARRLRLVVGELPGPLRLRHRAPGDRVVGTAGTHRLSDVFVDLGVPRAVRALWPVLVDARGRVVWVPGIVADAEVLAAGRRAPAGLLVVERVGGHG